MRRSESKSSDNDNISVRIDHNELEGESMTGSPVNNRSKSLRKLFPDKRGSDSDEEEEPTISFADAISEVMSLLPPEICPKKESSNVIQKPRSTLDALNPSDGKELASLPQSLLIKDITQLLQSLINKKVKIEPGWVSNQSLEKDLGISLKFYRTHSHLFPSSVPRLDKDASLLDLSSSRNVSVPIKSLETMERQARNTVTINSYADLFAVASVKSLQSEYLDAPVLKKMLTLVNCLKHSSLMAVLLAVELLQAWRESAIDKSKILTDSAKDKLRTVPIAAESLFRGQVAEIQKYNSESQQQNLIASSLARGNKSALSNFRILSAQPRNLTIGVLLYLDHLSNVREVAQEEANDVEVLVFVEGVIMPSPEEVPPTIPINETLSPLPRPQRDLPVGGRLAHFQKRWEDITEDSWVLSVIRKRYKIPFIRKPFLSPTPVFLRQTESPALEEEVKELLLKGAVEKINPEDPGFYSRIFLVPKKNWKLRLITDLSKLKSFLNIQSYKMETANKVRQSILPNDWAFSLDLTDAYLHVPIHWWSRKYLRFCIKGQTFQFKALPFGLATSPFVFTRLMVTIATHLRRRSVVLFPYLDDWLVRNQIRADILRDQ